MCELVESNSSIFLGTKKGFESIQKLISCNWVYGGHFLRKFAHLFKEAYYKILWLHVMCLRNIYILKLDTCIRDGKFGAFFVKI